MTSKIRITATALTAALTIGFAGAAVTEDASARPNDGRYQQSGEKIRLDLQDRCDRLQQSFNSHSDAANDFWPSSNGIPTTDEEKAAFDLARTYDDLAHLAQETAGRLGCGWALRSAASDDSLRGGPVGDDLVTQQPSDSPATGVESPETVTTGVDTIKSKSTKSKKCKKGKKKSKKCKKRAPRHTAG